MDLQTPITKGSRLVKQYASRLEKLGITTFEDFLLHIPSRYEDYSLVSKIADTQVGETVTIQGTVIEMKTNYLRGRRIKSMQKATVTDETGTIELVWFNQPYLTRSIPANSTISASGRVDVSGRKKQLASPQYEILAQNNAEQDAEQRGPIHTGRLIPVYPETKGISSKWLRRQIHALLQTHKDEIHEYMPEVILEKNHFIRLPEAMHEIHFPKNMQTAEQARERLAFDEFFFMQLAANIRRVAWKSQQTGNAFEIKKHQKKLKTFISSLPFELTNAQQRAIDDILKDFSVAKPMNRLLQGDVGSGKTIVAAVAMYAAHLNGYQSVLMAPTEILAQQHYYSIKKLLEPLGVKVDLVTGSSKSGSKKQELRIKDKEKTPDSSFMIHDSEEGFDILIGTHAVLSEKVKFNRLGFIAIDEQQRFGVEQRGIIRQKGDNPHLLTMTATPIPRTVALTMYGDLDLSYLDEMPHGRKKVKTWLVPPEKRNPAYDWMRKQIKETDSQVFIICPFIEPSESMETIKAASHEYERLRKDIFPDLKLGLLHGKLKAKEKEEVLQDFKDRKYDILVATPVVEVGIDVPNATIIMIEASERFGLSQLHQLRGRVGRGDKQSYCLLFTDNPTALTSQRLKGMETIYSGAELAELDLRLRGPGNLYGTAQHGVPKLKVASFSDTYLIQKAKYSADEIYPYLDRYPVLQEKANAVTLKIVSPD
jgi:ATP-dependent DNA helicase RecG